MSTAHIQNVVTNSCVIAKRGMSHECLPLRAEFVRRFKSAKHRYDATRHRPWLHKLPREWSNIMLKKTWFTTDETTYRKSAAAWHWLRTWGSMLRGIKTLEDALFSKLVFEGMVLLNIVTNQVVASMGNFTWACIVWPLREIACVDGSRIMAFDSNAEVEWNIYIYIDRYMNLNINLIGLYIYIY